MWPVFHFQQFCADSGLQMELHALTQVAHSYALLQLVVASLLMVTVCIVLFKVDFKLCNATKQGSAFAVFENTVISSNITILEKSHLMLSCPALPGLRGPDLSSVYLLIKVNIDYAWVRPWQWCRNARIVVRQCLLPFIVIVHESHATLVYPHLHI